MIEEVKINGEKYQSPSSQVVELIKSQIAAKRLRPGEKLPTIRELGRIMGVGNYSIRQAFASLTKEGIINSVRGSGTFVVEQANNGGNRKHKKDMRTFCLVSAFHNNGYLLELYHPATTAAILDECNEMKIKGRFLSPNVNLSSLDDIIEEIEERSYDGAIWLYPISDQWSLVKSLYDQKIPIVATAHSQYTVNTPCVQGNEVGTGQMIGNYLVKLGSRTVIRFREQDEPSGSIKDIRSSHHVGLKIGILNAYEEAGTKAPDIIDTRFTRENYRVVLKELLEHSDKKTCLMLANTKPFQDYLKESLDEAISLFRRCALIITITGNGDQSLVALAKEVDFMVSIHPLQNIGKAAVHKLVNIIEGKFEKTTTLVNGVFEKYKRS